MAVKKVHPEVGKFFLVYKEKWMEWDAWQKFLGELKDQVPEAERVWDGTNKQWAISLPYFEKVGKLHRKHFDNQSHDLFD